MREDVSPSTVLTTISASDQDSGSNGAVSFSLVSSTGPTGLFTVSPAGIVRVTSSLDRENTPQYSIQVGMIITICYQITSLCHPRALSDTSDRWRLSPTLSCCCADNHCH